LSFDEQGVNDVDETHFVRDTVERSMKRKRAQARAVDDDDDPTVLDDERDSNELSDDEIDERIDAIHERNRRRVTDIIDTGADLITLQSGCAKGKWQALFERDDGHPRLPFGLRTAQMYMAVAKSPVLTNPKNLEFLPPSLGAMYEMLPIPPTKLQEYIDAGSIHPDITRECVAKLMNDFVSAHTFTLVSDALHTLTYFGGLWPQAPRDMLKAIREKATSDPIDIDLLLQWLPHIRDALKEEV
jgi:hypothetical protein